MRVVALFLWLGLSAAALAAGGAAPGEAAGRDGVDADTVNASIDGFHARLVEVMQKARYGDRVAAMASVVPEFFDIGTVSRITLGRTWRELDAARKREFQELLKALIAATYADRFDSYNGQRFVRLDALEARRGWVVKTQLVRANGEKVNLDYYFNVGAVFNVVADGVSDLSLRRADYNSIIKQEGYDALIRHIKENIAEMRDNNEGDAS